MSIIFYHPIEISRDILDRSFKKTGLDARLNIYGAWSEISGLRSNNHDIDHAIAWLQSLIDSGQDIRDYMIVE